MASENSFDELHTYCSQFGRLENHFHYSVGPKKNNYILLEYENVQSADAALGSGIHKTVSKDHEHVQASSRFLWFCAGSKDSKCNVSNENTNNANKVSVVNGTTLKSNGTLANLLLNATNLNDQIQMVHQETRLNDVGMRLRSLGALQLESLLSGVFPRNRVIPFGSSVNGFGKMGSDLDLIVRLNDSQPNINGKRLVFHSKETKDTKKEAKSKFVEAIYPFIKLCAPGVEETLCISNARVPIIRYYHKHLDLNVDLSMSNM